MIKQTFIVAVSGGVDSVVLLHKLMSRKSNDITYVVAHFDHGMREESADDAEFVHNLADSYKLDYESSTGNLGSGASEADARDARYTFLRSVATKHGADKIITAHHQDDLLETMVLNMIRGTGPRGLSPMNQPDILRPLINRTKTDLIEYAKDNGLQWCEDETNTDDTYLRNYVRLNVMPELEEHREELLATQKRIEAIYAEVDARIRLLVPKKNLLFRPQFVSLPYSVQKELMRAWLVQNGVEDIDALLIERLTVACKTLPIGKSVDIKSGLVLKSEIQNILLTSK